jgi:hypothetical protein
VASDVPRVDFMVPIPPFVFRPVEKFFEVRLKVKMNMFQIAIGSSIVSQDIGSQVVGLMN